MSLGASKDTLTLKIKQNALKPRRDSILFDFQGQMLLWEGASKDTLSLKIKQNALKPRRDSMLFDFQGQMLLPGRSREAFLFIFSLPGISGKPNRIFPDFPGPSEKDEFSIQL